MTERTAAAARSALPQREVYVVFDRLPGGPDEPATFVEVEDAAGRSLSVPWGNHPQHALVRLGPFLLAEDVHG